MADTDPLVALRRAIASNTLPTPTTSSNVSDAEAHATDDLATATHLLFQNPAQTIALTTPTRFVSSSSEAAVDLRGIFFAWQKKDVAIPEYIASATELNEALKQAPAPGAGGEDGSAGEVHNLVFVERLDLITWLEGASDESEYIKPLEGAAAAAEADAQAEAAKASSAQAQASANVAAGVGAGAGAGGVGAPAGTGAGTGATGRAPKSIDPRLQEIYNGERKMGDRNSVLRGIKPTDFSHVRKTAETILRRKPQPKPAKPAPSAGLVPKTGRHSNPIILLSPSASSLIRMTNVKSFLQDGVFVPPDHPTLSMTSTAPNILEIQRPAPTQAPGASGPSSSNNNSRSSRTSFTLVDSTANFRPDYWNRLVAVFTTGQTWQFKSYKWSSPPELFKHATGIYVGWRGEDAPREVKGWGRGVERFAVERWDEGRGVHGAGRWRDREVVEGIWRVVDEGMRIRGWN